MALVSYFGGLWMTFNEELQGQISKCLQRTYICIIYTTHRMIELSVHENWEKKQLNKMFVFYCNASENYFVITVTMLTICICL